MKKTIALILALVLCLSMLACAPKTFPEAVEKMEELLADWNDGHRNGFAYTCVYDEEKATYVVVMDPIHLASTPDLYSENDLKLCTSLIYEDASKCFSALDVTLGVIVVTENGTILYTCDASNYEK